jgi:uncharacterized protein involved in outer membrane biogenesis
VFLDANILRQPIANYIGQKLERPFSINGDFRIGLSNHPHVEVEGIVLGNAPWSTQSKMVQIERARISIAILPLLRGHIVLPEVELIGPDVVLERDIDGETNWNFGSDPGAQSKPPTHPPEIRSLRIDRGKLVFRDPQSKTEIELAVNSLKNSIRTAVPLKLAQRNSSSRVDDLAIQDLRIYDRALPAGDRRRPRHAR